MLNQFKTIVFLTLFIGIFMAIGGLIAGINGIIFAFLMGLLINFCLYYFSENIVLNIYNAQKLDQNKYAFIYNIVSELTNKSSIPMPKLWLVNHNMANAFATGRNPKNASVALTTGILNILNERELRAVLAHEISHIKNRDILVSTIAATVATSISLLANIRYRLNYKRKNNAVEIIILLLITILAPLISTMIKAAISRSREYFADECGAKISKDPLSLASALEKLQASTVTMGKENYSYAATSHLFIVNPFTSTNLYELFSTHPSVAKRVKKLEDIHNNINSK